VKSRSKEESPVPVPARANPAGEVRARWVWVEPTIWTDRMLSALEKGVRGGRWQGQTPTLPSSGFYPFTMPG